MYTVLLVSGVLQSDSFMYVCVYIYIYSFFFRFLSHIGYNRILCAI